MSATVFSKVKIKEEVMSDCKHVWYKLQLPSVWVAAGIDPGFDDDMDFVYGMIVCAGDAITDHEQKYSLIGTYDTDDYAYTASTVKIVAHHGGGAGAALDAVADATDLSGVANLIVMVMGK